MQRIPIIFSILLLIAPIKDNQAGTKDKLIFGFLPYFSANKLVTLHKPMVEHLRTSLNAEISIVSAPSFKEFLKRSREGNYDLVFTAPHMGRLAELESNYHRVVMSTHRGRPTFLAKKEGSISSLKDLKGGKISLPPPKAIIHHVALKALRSDGLEPGKDIEIVATPSHSSALLAVINGQVGVAVMGKSPWGSYKKEYADRIRLLSVSHDIPGFFIMAHPRLTAERVKEIQKALLELNSNINGKSYFDKSALEGFAPIDELTMEELDPYVKAIFGIQ